VSFTGCSVINPTPEEGTMTSKHPIACIALSAAVALKLLAGTTQPPVMHDQHGRGVDIARIDGQI
jgi:hypothetical protein